MAGPKKDLIMGIFKNKKELSRTALRKAFRKASPYIPGAGGKTYSQKERTELEKKLFGSKYGSYLTKAEYKKKIQELKGQKYRAKTSAEKLKIDRQTRYLESLID